MPVVDFDRLADILEQNTAEEIRREVEHRRHETAVELGLDPAEVKVNLLAHADRISRKGVIVDLSIGRERFLQNLSPDDIGLNFKSDDMPEGFKEYLDTLNLGKRSLVTSDYRRLILDLDNIESRARRALYSNSFPIFGIGRTVLRFVPISCYRTLRDTLAELEAEYFEKVDEIIQELDRIRESTRIMLHEAASEVFKIAKRTLAAPQDLDELQEFRRNFINSALADFPTEVQVRGAAYFNVETMLVPFAADTGSNALLEEHKEVLQEIKKTLVEEKNRFVSSVVAHLNRVVYDAVVSASACIKKHGTLLGPNVTSLKEAMTVFERLNEVVGDVSLARQLERLQTLVLDGKTRDIGNVALALNDLQENTRKVLETLGQVPRAKRGAVDDAGPIDVSAIPSRKRRGKVDVVESPEPDAPVVGRRQRMSASAMDMQMALWA
jgi:hypothetical protein